MTWHFLAIDAKRAAIPTVTAGLVVMGVDATDWGIIAGGILIGIMARWAVMLNANAPVGWREVRIDALMMLANAVLAAQFGEALHLHGVRLAVAATLFGASSTMLFSAIHRRFIAQTIEQSTTIFTGPGTVTSVPRRAPDVKVHSVDPDPDANTTAEIAVRALKRAPLPPAPEIDALIDKLDEEKK